MSNKTLIIAEAGVNHNGDIHTAKQLIDAAADAGDLDAIADALLAQRIGVEGLVGQQHRIAQRLARKRHLLAKRQRRGGVVQAKGEELHGAAR